MKNIDLKLICEVLTPTKSTWKEIGMCIPLGMTWYNKLLYTTAERLVINYFIKNPPKLFSLRFTDSAGDEPRYDQITPNIWQAHEPTWACIYKNWSKMLQSLIGNDNVCYFLGWEDMLLKQFSKGYDGKVVRVEDSPDRMVYIECTSKFIETNIRTNGKLWQKTNVWTYGGEGYIIPRVNETKIQLWATVKECAPEVVEDFFNSTYCVFLIKYETEGIWLLSHKLTLDDIKQRLLKGVETHLICPADQDNTNELL